MNHRYAHLIFLLLTTSITADFITGLERLWDAIKNEKINTVQVENIKNSIVTCSNKDRAGMNDTITTAMNEVAIKKQLREALNPRQDLKKTAINKQINEAEEKELKKLYDLGDLYTSTHGEICDVSKSQKDLCDQLGASLPGQEKLFPTQCQTIMPSNNNGDYQSHNAESIVTCSIRNAADKEKLKKDIQENNSSTEEFLKTGTTKIRVHYPACQTLDSRNACLFMLNSGEPIQLQPTE